MIDMCEDIQKPNELIDKDIFLDEGVFLEISNDEVKFIC